MLSTDLKFYKEKANGRLAGGTSNLIVSGVVQNLWPHVTSAQRTAGFFDYKGWYAKVGDDADGTLIDPSLLLDAPTLSATDYMMYFTLGLREAITSISGYDTGVDSETKYGSAKLKNNITGGDSTLTVTVKNAAMSSGADAIFRDGGKIKITDKLTADALTGNEEVCTISGAPSVSGSDVTITVTGTITSSYTADGTIARVSSLIKPGDIACSNTTPSKTSAAGTIDFSTYPIILDNIGTVEEDWTITFTDATHFTLTGDDHTGSVATGVISSNFAPNNTDFTKPYFTIESGVWGGTWAAGDTVTFTTHPAALHLGGKRVVPAGTASLSNNKATLVFEGEAV